VDVMSTFYAPIIGVVIPYRRGHVQENDIRISTGMSATLSSSMLSAKLSAAPARNGNGRALRMRVAATANPAEEVALKNPVKVHLRGCRALSVALYFYNHTTTPPLLGAVHSHQRRCCWEGGWGSGSLPTSRGPPLARPA
jgi:hypothetical protein